MYLLVVDVRSNIRSNIHTNIYKRKFNAKTVQPNLKKVLIPITKFQKVTI